ncbi:hypothetical protein [Microbacterium sp. NPDC055455]
MTSYTGIVSRVGRVNALPSGSPIVTHTLIVPAHAGGGKGYRLEVTAAGRAVEEVVGIATGDRLTVELEPASLRHVLKPPRIDHLYAGVQSSEDGIRIISQQNGAITISPEEARKILDGLLGVLDPRGTMLSKRIATEGHLVKVLNRQPVETE